MIACDCQKLESIHPSITLGCSHQFKGRPTRPMCKNQNDTDGHQGNCRQRPCTRVCSKWPDSMDMEGEVDPNAVTQEARSGKQKASFYLKADYKNQKQTKRGQEAK